MRLTYSLDYYSFLILLFSIPFGRKLFLPIFAIWSCFVLLTYFVKLDYSKTRFKGLLVIPIIYFFIYSFGIILTSDHKEIFNDLLFKLSLLLLPILYPFNRQLYKDGKSTMLKSYVIGCFSASLFYFGHAVYRSLYIANGRLVLDNGWHYYFLSNNFSYFVHPSYLALFFLVAILIVVIEKDKWFKTTITGGFNVFLTTFPLLISLIILQSRAGIIGLGLLMLCFFLYSVVKRKYIVGLTGLFFLLALVFISFTRFERYENTMTSLRSTAGIGVENMPKENGTSIRFWIWKSAILSISEHPITGVGPQNVRKALCKHYVEWDMKVAAGKRLNAHNQYLETWLGLGVFGLIVLLALLFVPIWIGVKKRDWLLVGAISLCSFSFIFESMLETISGIFFFAVLYTLLVSPYVYSFNLIPRKFTLFKRKV